VGRGGDGHGLPALLLNRQHVITQQGFHQVIGHPFGRVLVGGHHQQIDIREAIPIAPGQGAVAKASPQEYSQTLQSLGPRVS
jgi:hypothetical protein